MPLVTIPQGKIGYVFARDGRPLAPMQTLASNPVATDFQDATVFLSGGGQKGPFDLIHLFATEAAPLPAALAAARERLVPNGTIWVSWPKQAAKVATDVTEHVVRRDALAAGLVDVKVCAVDATWSGLKLVIPRAARG